MLQNQLGSESLIFQYHRSENMMEKAKIIHTLRTEYNYPFNILSELLYEVERQLYRINSLNRLIPEFQRMAAVGTLRRLDAYSLSGQPEDIQRKIYNQVQNQRKDFMRKAKHEEFMKVVELVAKERKKELSK